MKRCHAQTILAALGLMLCLACGSDGQDSQLSLGAKTEGAKKPGLGAAIVASLEAKDGGTKSDAGKSEGPKSDVGKSEGAKNKKKVDLATKIKIAISKKKPKDPILVTKKDKEAEEAALERLKRKLAKNKKPQPCGQYQFIMTNGLPTEEVFLVEACTSEAIEAAQEACNAFAVWYAQYKVYGTCEYMEGVG